MQWKLRLQLFFQHPDLQHPQSDLLPHIQALSLLPALLKSPCHPQTSLSGCSLLFRSRYRSLHQSHSLQDTVSADEWSGYRLQQPPQRGNQPDFPVLHPVILFHALPPDLYSQSLHSSLRRVLPESSSSPVRFLPLLQSQSKSPDLLLFLSSYLSEERHLRLLFVCSYYVQGFL